MTLRITDGCQDKADASVVKSKAFRLMIEDARSALDVVTSIYILLISLFILNCLLIFMCFVLGSFLVNDISALVLFD